MKENPRGQRGGGGNANANILLTANIIRRTRLADHQSHDE